MANEKFTNALNGLAQDVPPIWMMRQAGRYHAHYQNLRKKHSFIELCKKSKLAAEVAMGPIEDFDFDVAILFSDLLFPLEALGMGLKYDPAPELGWHLKEMKDFKKMKSLDKALAELVFQKEAVEETRKVLPDSKSLIGFVGSPWTLFVYAVCGSHKGNLISAKKRMSFFKPFCEHMVPLLVKNIELQLEGGAEIIMLFDTAAGDLSPDVYNRYVAPVVRTISRQFPQKMAYYSKGTQGAHLQSLWQDSEFCGFGYDHRWNLTDCFDKHSGFKQGNFDQTLLFLPPNEFEKELMSYLEPLIKLSPAERKGWVCGLGHGVLPETPNENVKTFIRKVREVFHGS